MTKTLAAIKKIDFTEFDGLIHAGDVSYDVQFFGGKQGEDYFNTLSFVNARTPYFVIAGNHEVYDKAWAFNYRLMLPNYNSLFQNSVYSSIRGNVFFLFVNYDYFFSIFRGTKMMFFEYVRQELERSRDPSIIWRVVVSHRPIICGDSLTIDCFYNLYGFKIFDELYRKYNVNIFLNGHVHFYQRVRLMNTRFESAKFTKTTDNIVATYSNLKDPMIIIAGCAGSMDLASYEVIDTMADSTITDTECYSDMTFDEQRFSYTVYNSGTMQPMDKTIINRTPPATPDSSNGEIVMWWRILIMVVVAVLAGLGVMLFLIKCKLVSQASSSKPGPTVYESKTQQAQASEIKTGAPSSENVNFQVASAQQ